MSRILFWAFEAPPVSVAAAASIGDEWTAAAIVTETVTASVVASMTGEWSAAAFGIGGVQFIPPEHGDPRVAVVTH